MKKAEIKILCLSMLVVLLSSARMNANDGQTLEHNATLELISEVQHLDQVALPLNLEVNNKTLATSMAFAACYELRRVWVWSGWWPKRVWRYVRVACPQTGGNGPGTTIPPH